MPNYSLYVVDNAYTCFTYRRALHHVHTLFNTTFSKINEIIECSLFAVSIEECTQQINKWCFVAACNHKSIPNSFLHYNA